MEILFLDIRGLNILFLTYNQRKLTENMAPKLYMTYFVIKNVSYL